MSEGTCAVERCEQRAAFDAPGVWCEHHWLEWWNWADGPEPAWMRPEVTDDG